MLCFSPTAHTNNQGNPERKLLKPGYSKLKLPPYPQSRATKDQDYSCTICKTSKCNLTPGTCAGTSLLAENYWLTLYLYPTHTLPYSKKKTKLVSWKKVENICTNFMLLLEVTGHKYTKIEMQDNIYNKLEKQRFLRSKEKIGRKILKYL